jgi:peptidoglycan/xylan/chitin deacetylase (PgdA/CDA1 family)
MYHALYASAAELEAIAPEDRAYAVSRDEFRRQLDLLPSLGLDVIPAEEFLHATDQLRSGVVLTFDDGHGSGWLHAYPELSARRQTAFFFLTSGFVGVRPGFLTWNDARELRRGGMQIGAHGATHRFLTDLTPSELERELGQMQRAFEQELGRRPATLSFPGGRQTPSVVRACKEAGFRVLFGSRVGIVSTAKHLDGDVVPRIAVRQRDRLPKFATLARPTGYSLGQARVVDSGKALLRRLVGNRAYHRIYRVLGG